MQLQICDLSKSYGPLPVLSRLSMTLRQEECYCLMAPSGAGKTTLLRLLMGLEQPDSGQIFLEQEDGSRLSPGRITTAAVFQEDRLCESFTALENVQIAAAGISRSDLRREMALLLPEECLDRPVFTLSGGMKRRTAILRALLSPSELLLMDEPFTGLDTATRQEAIHAILRLRRGRFLLIATHQEEDVALLNGQLWKLPLPS